MLVLLARRRPANVGCGIGGGAPSSSVLLPPLGVRLRSPRLRFGSGSVAMENEGEARIGDDEDGLSVWVRRRRMGGRVSRGGDDEGDGDDERRVVELVGSENVGVRGVVGTGTTR